LTHEPAIAYAPYSVERLDRQDWLRITIILIVALVLRVWIVANTEVCARDTIGFVRYARMLDEQPASSVVRSMHQMPGFPLALLLVSKPVLAVHNGPESEAYVLSAQIVNVLASLLTVPALYIAGRVFGSKNCGLFAALLFQLLPGWLQVTSDGLSEGLFFLFVAWGFAFGVLALQEAKVHRFALAGLFTGAAYLTRPEGAELLPVICLATIVFGLMKWGWRATALRLTVVILCATPFIAGYVATTGSLTNKPTSRIMLQGQETAAADTHGSLQLPLAVFIDTQTQAASSKWLTATKMLGSETSRSLRYVGGLLALAGVAIGWRQLRFNPAYWLGLFLTALHALVLWRMAFVIGYLSERHTLLIVLPALMYAGIALERWGEYFSSHVPRLRFAPIVVVLGIGLSGFSSLSKPLHFNRAGHHAAGRWLADNVQAEDEVMDPYAWAYYYSESMFREGRPTLPGPRCKFVVIENGHEHPRLPLVSAAKSLSLQGEAVYSWARNKHSPEVVVYRIGKQAN